MFADKWVRIMCDYGADGVWDSDGCSCPADALPLPAELVARIRAWQKVYDSDAWAPPCGPTISDFWDFAREGLEIARAVKGHLPDWTVIFFDEVAAAQGEERHVYEYEIR